MTRPKPRRQRGVVLTPTGWQKLEEAIRAIAFTHDGHTVISGSEDETIRFWDVKTGECFKILQSPGSYAGMKITGVTGLTEAQKATLLALGAVE